MSDLISREAVLELLETAAKGTIILGGQKYRTIQIGEIATAIRALPAVQVHDALHRSFPEAGDGRPMPPMGDELMIAGLNEKDARFVAVQLAQNGLRLVDASQTPDPDTKMRCAECWCDGGECEWIATGNETEVDPVSSFSSGPKSIDEFFEWLESLPGPTDELRKKVEWYKELQRQQQPDPVLSDPRVKVLVEKMRDWEARIEDCEWSANSSLTEDIRAEMRAALRAIGG